MLHPVCFKLAPIPIALVWVYPYLKKISWLSHFVLGIILGIAPYGAWLASRGSGSWAPGLLMLAVTSWVSGFDMVYALQDIDFDRKHGLKSFPVEFGVERTLSAVRYLHGVTIAALFGVGFLLKMGVWSWAGWGVVVGLIVREHQLVQRHGLKKINEAFFGMNALVSAAIFIAAAMDLTFRF
jgi:4-hydroxybenzoate polyprenyltransferase